MATKAIVGIEPAGAGGKQRSCTARAHSALADYWTLTKPEINFLIAIATSAGFYVGRPSASRDFPFWLLIHALLGTLLVASGTGTLNQYLERRFDAQMRRTAKRPLAAGRLEPSIALWFGIALSVAGTAYLAVATHLLASLLAFATLVSYLFLYTPLKRKTPFCTLMGAIPGAMPPLIGAAAASGRLNLEAWLLYMVLFQWQFPHFMSIAWMYREDYSRASFLVLPSGRLKDRYVVVQSLVPLAALVPVSLLPALLRQGSLLYIGGALLLSLSFLYCGIQFARCKSTATARRLLMASIFYLPLLFALIVVFGY